MNRATLRCNHKRYVHGFIRKEVDASIDLLAWLDHQNTFPKMYWQSSGKEEERACVGSLLTLDEVPVFDPGNDSPARFWGGHTFFRAHPAKDKSWHTFPPIAFFLPQYELIKTHGKTELILHSLDASIPGEPVITPLSSLSPVSFSHPQTHLPSQAEWTRLVEEALTRIQARVFEKVILARRSTHSVPSSCSLFSLLAHAQTAHATCFALQFDAEQAFMGATPESLYKREGRHVFTEAVAGTRPRGADGAQDRLLEKELQESEKERREFSYVKGSIEQALSPLCETCYFGTNQVRKTPTVQHLSATAQGHLKPKVTDSDLLYALHPTAALGGAPKQEALTHLLHQEPFERGWYGAPLGYISEKEAHFVVAIRSALVEQTALHLYAGAGIVAGSDPQREWEELGYKTRHWRTTL